jgi:hypothetical protein
LATSLELSLRALSGVGRSPFGPRVVPRALDDLMGGTLGAAPSSLAGPHAGRATARAATIAERLAVPPIAQVFILAPPERGRATLTHRLNPLKGACRRERRKDQTGYRR